MRKAIIVVVGLFLILSSSGGVQAAAAKKGASKDKSPTTREKPATDAASGKATPAKAEKPAVPLNERYTDKGDGTILDKNTGLIWLKEANISNLPPAKRGREAVSSGDEQREAAEFWFHRLAPADRQRDRDPGGQDPVLSGASGRSSL